MKTSRNAKNSGSSRSKALPLRDALRVMVALLGILFASIASVDHEAASNLNQSQTQMKAAHVRPHALPRTSQPNLPILQRINGSM